MANALRRVVICEVPTIGKDEYVCAFYPYTCMDVCMFYIYRFFVYIMGLGRTPTIDRVGIDHRYLYNAAAKGLR